MATLKASSRPKHHPWAGSFLAYHLKDIRPLALRSVFLLKLTAGEKLGGRGALRLELLLAKIWGADFLFLKKRTNCLYTDSF